MKTRIEIIAERVAPPMKPIILVATALVMMFSIMGVSYCNFMVASAEVFDQNGTVAIGLYGRSIYDSNGSSLGCVSYNGSPEFMDGSFSAGRAFGTMTAASTTLSFVITMLSVVWLPKKVKLYWTAAKVLLGFSVLWQLLTFVVVGSSVCQQDVKCTLSAVGVLGMFNTFALLGLVALFFREKEPRQPWLQMWDDGDPAAVAIKSGVDEADASIQVGSGESVSGDESIATTAPVASDAEGVEDTLRFRFSFLILVCVAWTISVLGIRHCTFILAGPTETDRSSYSGLGLYRRAAYDRGDVVGCIAYAADLQDGFDPAFVAGKAFGTISMMLLSLSLCCCFALLFSQRYSHKLWNSLRIFLPLAALGQLLMFCAFGTETCSTPGMQCKVGTAGILAAINIFLSMFLSCTVFRVAAPTHPVLMLARHLYAKEVPKTSIQYVESKSSKDSCDDHGIDEQAIDTSDDKVSVTSVLRKRSGTEEIEMSEAMLNKGGEDDMDAKESVKTVPTVEATEVELPSLDEGRFGDGHFLDDTMSARSRPLIIHTWGQSPEEILHGARDLDGTTMARISRSDSRDDSTLETRKSLQNTLTYPSPAGIETLAVPAQTLSMDDDSLREIASGRTDDKTEGDDTMEIRVACTDPFGGVRCTCSGDIL